jgi:predicted metal-dependent hydrolase
VLTSSPALGLPVTVVRSDRRTRSSSARVVDGRIVVRVPAWFSAAQEDEVVRELVRKVERRHVAADIDLDQRAAALARQLGLPTPAEIRWVDNQGARWGSCTPSVGTIRISSRLSKVPAYVLDYVIVHELAHLVEHGHTPAFHAIVDAYPKAERAKGYLEAIGLVEEAANPTS